MKDEELKDALGPLPPDKAGDPVKNDEASAEDADLDTDGTPEGSILQNLKERRKAIGERVSTVIPIPGYKGLLAAEYRKQQYESVSKQIAAAQRTQDPQKELSIATDMLVQACIQIHVRDDRDGKLHPMHEVVTEYLGDDPVRFDTRLGRAVGVDGDRARIICQGVFDNDLALLAHHAELVQWWRGTAQTDDDDF